MFLTNISSSCDQRREALRYQPSFDLRKNIAKVVAYHSLGALKKNITLDIFVSPETPNYFQGNMSSFLVILSQLLKHSIDSLDGGEINIRVHQESLHKSNSCETEIAIIVTSRSLTKLHNFTEVVRLPRLPDPGNDEKEFNDYMSLLRLNRLCKYFEGSYALAKLDDHTIRYRVNFVLQQAHPSRMLHLV